IDSERLPRLVEMNKAENWPVGSTDWRLRRVMSPVGGSTLITSAPWSARNVVANGPDTTLVRSMTRTPDNGPVMRHLQCRFSTYTGGPAASQRRRSHDGATKTNRLAENLILRSRAERGVSKDGNSGDVSHPSRRGPAGRSSG